MASKKRERRDVQIEEQKIAGALGGHTTYNSGAGDEKGDGRVPHSMYVIDGDIFERTNWAFRIENKQTGKSWYRMSTADWSKLHRAARAHDEIPLFVVRLTAAVARAHLRLVVVPANYLNEMMKLDALPPTSSRTLGYRLTERRWQEAVEQSPELPHIRVELVETRRNRPDFRHDLVVLEWRWFLMLIENAE